MNKLKINVKLLMNDKRCEPENDGRCLQRPHFLNLIKFHKFDLDKGGEMYCHFTHRILKIKQFRKI